MIYIYICTLYVWMCVCVCVYICVYMCVCVYVCICIGKRLSEIARRYVRMTVGKQHVTNMSWNISQSLSWCFWHCWENSTGWVKFGPQKKDGVKGLGLDLTQIQVQWSKVKTSMWIGICSNPPSQDSPMNQFMIVSIRLFIAIWI